MSLTTPHVLILSSLRAKGWPAELVEHLLSLCSASREEYEQLSTLGHVETAGGRGFF
jgi:hypothetical protein